jgi:tRNA-intron lyase
MYSAKLTAPRRKKFFKGLIPQQSFPIPIASLTGLEAQNSTWRWYEGTLQNNDTVEITDADAIKMLSTMGYFGETLKKGAQAERFVSVENFDPLFPTFDCETLQEDASLDLDDHNVMSSGEESDITNGQEEEAKTGWKKWRAADEGDQVLILDSFETLFLAHGLGCLIVKNAANDLLMSIDDLWQHFSEHDGANFRYRYAAFHHFRAKNWIVRNGTKFGNNFLLYKVGPPFYHASYSVRVQTGKSTAADLTWAEMAALNRVTESAAKELMIAEVWHNEHKIKENTSINEYLDNVVVKEVLVRRWVASQKREND